MPVEPEYQPLVRGPLQAPSPEQPKPPNYITKEKCRMGVVLAPKMAPGSTTECNYSLPMEVDEALLRLKPAGLDLSAHLVATSFGKEIWRGKFTQVQRAKTVPLVEGRTVGSVSTIQWTPPSGMAALAGGNLSAESVRCWSALLSLFGSSAGVQYNDQVIREISMGAANKTGLDALLLRISSVGYAIVDHNGSVIKSGPVFHICLSSYTTELWALIVAFCGCSTCVHIHTDCKSLADQVEYMCAHEQIDFTWTHVSWWLFLLDILRRRKQFSSHPLKVSWCPAHQADDIPIELLTPQIAASRGCDFLDLMCSRKADIAAKRAALQQCSPKSLENEIRKITNWQIWLSRIHAEISKDSKAPRLQPQQPDVARNHVNVLPYQISTVHHTEAFKHLLPKWLWEDDPNTYSWKPSCDTIPFPDSHANISRENWDLISQWMLNLKWKVGPNFNTSSLELASQAWHDGIRLNTRHSPKVYMQMIQKVANQTKKMDSSLSLVPGVVEKKCKSNGKTHPIGRISNAQVYVNDEALKAIAVQMLHGANHMPSLWDTPFT